MLVFPYEQAVLHLFENGAQGIGDESFRLNGVEDEFFHDADTFALADVLEHDVVVGHADEGLERTVLFFKELVHVLVDLAVFREPEQRKAKEFLLCDGGGYVEHKILSCHKNHFRGKNMKEF